LTKAETGMKHLAAMLSGLLLAFAAALPGAAEARSELSASFAANLQADAGCNDALVTESVRATEIDREDNRSGPAPDTAFPHRSTDVPALAGSCSGVATPAPIQGGIASAPYQARAPPRM
jgi:hypothetical protein